MMTMRVADIPAGTQIRTTLRRVVEDYAARMSEGATFPPIVVFIDNDIYHLADGFHRLMAAKHNGLSEIEVDLRTGTENDALWFALGANRDHGLQMTDLDKTRAVQLALRAWPDRFHSEIAKQVGCSASLVSKVSSTFTVESGAQEMTGKARRSQQQRQKVVAVMAAGETHAAEIAKQAGVSQSFVSKVRAETGLQSFDRTRAGIVKRRKDIRDMAERGFSTRQIAAAVGLSTETVGTVAKAEQIVIHADRVTGKSLHHDANRIVSQMAMDADNLTADVGLIEFHDLDKTHLRAWVAQFEAARKSLAALIRRLQKEQLSHEGQNHAQAV